MDSANAKTQIKQHEGLRLTVYDDATGQPIVPGSHVIGHPTIGYGRALDVHGISESEAQTLYEHDLVAIAAQLDKRIPWWRQLDDVRQGALAEMAYQMGMAGLLGFRLMLQALKDGRYAAAEAQALNSKWARQTPARAADVAARLGRG